MVVIRGTKKFLDRVGRAVSEPAPSTTVLGDWYANVLFWRPQVALFVNERTLLPVLVPLVPAASVISRLPPTVELVLGLYGLSGSFIAHELDAMDNAVLAKTASRSVVGMLNEFGYLATTWRPSAGNLLDLSLRLATVPCGPLYKTHIDPRHAVAAAADEWILEHR